MISIGSMYTVNSRFMTGFPIFSNPMLLAKLNNGGSALDSISERLAFAAAQRNEHEQESYRTTSESPIALNLSSKGGYTLANIPLWFTLPFCFFNVVRFRIVFAVRLVELVCAGYVFHIRSMGWVVPSECLLLITQCLHS